MPLICLFAAASLAAPLSIRDLIGIAQLSSPDLSPDGKSAVFVRSVASVKDDKTETALLEIDLASGILKPLTKPGQDVQAPKWLPSGKEIAFLTTPAGGQTQVVIVSSSGDRQRQVTHAKNGVEQFAWSPTGDRIAFVTPDDPANADAVAHHDDLFDIHDDGMLISSLPAPSHIWIQPARGGEARRLTHGSWSVLETVAPFMGGPSTPSWSAEGSRIVFARQANADNSDSDLSRVASVDVASGAVTDLTSASSYEYQPKCAPVGNRIAYIRPSAEPLSRMDVWGGEAANANNDLSAPLDREIIDLAFEPDGIGLIAEANDGVQTPLFQIKPGDAPKRLSLGALSAADYTVGPSGKIAFVGSSSTSLPELYVLDDGQPRKLTSLNAFAEPAGFQSSNEFWWRAADGQANDGVVTYPAAYEPGKKYPLMVWVHGGPEGSSTSSLFGWEALLLRQSFASHGSVVFEPNYRGSDNLGNAHERAIFADAVGGPGSDILAGVDALVATGCVDPQHVSVGGHSYGGTMTSWLIEHDHRWRSAVAADGNYDWVNEYNCSDSGNLAFSRDSLGGSPTQIPDVYRANSTINFADHISTPTLVVTGLADQQVPFVQAFALYHILHDRGVETRLVGIPGSPHSPQRPVQRERYYETMLDWVIQHDK